jgi:hypothetical protein
MAQKRCPDEEKSDFEFLAFLVSYYINKACVNITNARFIVRLIYKMAISRKVL